MNLKKITVSLLAGVLLAGSALGADEYVLDKSHSSVNFVVNHMVITKVRGNFTEFDGTIMIDDKDITNSSVKGTVKVASINTNNEKRDAHLRGEDFFDAEKFPEITFESKKVVKKGDNLVCAGLLTIRGVTKEVEIPFTITDKIKDPWGNERVGIEASFTINRQDYGVSWSNVMDNGGLVVSNDVKIELDAQGIKKAK